MEQQYCQFNFEIDDVSENYEISVLDILGNARKKNIHPDESDRKESSLLPTGFENNALSNIAASLEKKYGPVLSVSNNQKKRRIRIKDYKRYHLDYDVEDAFIDDSEFVDDVLDPDVTTTVGGFYVNTGVAEGIIDHELDAKLRAKWKMDDSVSNHSMDSIPEQTITKQSPPSSIAKPSPDKEPNKSEQSISPAPEISSSSVVTNGHLTPPSIVETSTPNPSAPPRFAQPPADSVEQEKENDIQKPVSTTTSPILLPELSEDLEAVINKLKDRGKMKDVSARNFFDIQTASHLLELDRLLNESQLKKSQRLAVYSHLEQCIPPKRTAMLKRIKSLKEEKCQRSLNPWIKALESEVNRQMPELKEQYEKDLVVFEDRFNTWKTEHSKYLTDKNIAASIFDSSIGSEADSSIDLSSQGFSQNGSSPTSSKKPVKPNNPRRIYQWSPNAKVIFEKILNIKLKSLQELNVKGSAEDNLKKFFEETLVHVWPKGWMTPVGLWRKAVPILIGLKQGDSIVPSHPMESASSDKSTHGLSTHSSTNVKSVAATSNGSPHQENKKVQENLVIGKDSDDMISKRAIPKPPQEEVAPTLCMSVSFKESADVHVPPSHKKSGDAVGNLFTHLDDILSSVLHPSISVSGSNLSTTNKINSSNFTDLSKLIQPVSINSAIPSQIPQEMSQNTLHKLKRKVADSLLIGSNKIKKVKQPTPLCDQPQPLQPKPPLSSNVVNKDNTVCRALSQPTMPTTQDNVEKMKKEKIKRLPSKEELQPSSSKIGSVNQIPIASSVKVSDVKPQSTTDVHRHLHSMAVNGTNVSLANVQTTFSHINEIPIRKTVAPTHAIPTTSYRLPSPELPRYEYHSAKETSQQRLKHDGRMTSSSFNTIERLSQSSDDSRSSQTMSTAAAHQNEKRYSNYPYTTGLLPSVEELMDFMPRSFNNTGLPSPQSKPTVPPLRISASTSQATRDYRSASYQTPTMPVPQPQSSPVPRHLSSLDQRHQQQQYGSPYSKMSSPSYVGNSPVRYSPYEFVSPSKNVNPHETQYKGQYSPFHGHYPSQ